MPATNQNLDQIIQSLIMALKVLAPLTKTILDNKALSFLIWLQGDEEAKKVMLACPCTDCDLKNRGDLPNKVQEQIDRWWVGSGFKGSGITKAIDWNKTIAMIIEIWKLISVFMDKPVIVSPAELVPPEKG